MDVAEALVEFREELNHLNVLIRCLERLRRSKNQAGKFAANKVGELPLAKETRGERSVRKPLR